MRKSKCPTKWKIAHPTRGEAERHARGLHTKPGGRVQHAYQCECGAWHVGNANIAKRGKRNRRSRR